MTAELNLIRNERIADGTFGELMVAFPRLMLHTMEDDWLDNAKGKSCIPAGTYKLHRTIFLRHKLETFEVADVPGRSRILIHPANTEEDVEGCIGVGMRRGVLPVARDEDTGALNVKKQAVVASQEAFSRFMSAMVGYDEVTLTITWASHLGVK